MPEGEQSLLDSILQSAGPEGLSTLQLLFPKDGHLKMESEIPPAMVTDLSVVGMVATKFKSKVLKNFVKEFLTLQISKDRKGRLELVEAMLAQRRSLEEEE